MRRVLLFALLLCALPLKATTWFIRTDGGTRFSSAVTAGQCNGQADAAYPGTGTNQACAFNDVRYLWSDNSGSAMAWVIVGGDTVVVRGCHALAAQQNPSNPNCRLGYDNDNNGNPPNEWCGSGTPNTNCFPPPVPSGTSGAHTRFLGGCAYDSTPGPCHATIAVTAVTSSTVTVGTQNGGNINTLTNLTQLFSGMGLGWAINIRGSQWVDFDGIELTTHNKVNTGTAFTPSGSYTSGQIIFDGTNTYGVTTAGTAGSTFTSVAVGSSTTTGGVTFLNEGPNCIRAGTPAYPVGCQHGSTPYDDYGDEGFFTTNTTGNITFTDMWVHGFSASGFYGSIGGAITMTRVNASYNAFAGWNFDESTVAPNGTGVPNNPLASIAASDVTMDWNGCNAEYPVIDAIPCLIAYSIINGGFGDAWSGQDSNLASMTCDHCEISDNIKDAFFGPHTAIGAATITNSYAANNGGQTWKGNFGASGTFVMKNNVTNDNCRRHAQATTGAPSTYNQGISGNDLCRADGTAISILLPINGSVELDNNTFTAASVNVGFDLGCYNLATGASIYTGGSGLTANEGTGYAIGDIIYVGGGGTVVTVTSVGGGGNITGLSLTTAGQIVNPTENYNFDSNGTGSGAWFSIATTPANCNGGTRIMRNNNFIGYTNSNNSSWNGQTINFICYAGCAGDPGNSTDAMWTTRSNNNMYGFQNGTDGACTYAGETCVSPLMTVQPSQTWTSETQLDPYNPRLTASANSFYPTSGSPLVAAGTAVSGITADFFGVATTSPPVIGAVNFFTGSSTVATPTASPVAGTYGSTQTVTLSDSTGGATICYTTDGTTPTASGGSCTHGTAYSVPITVSITTTIQAIGTLSGDTNSGVASFPYTITGSTVHTLSFGATLSLGATVSH